MADCPDLQALLVSSFGLTSSTIEANARAIYDAHYVAETHHTHDGLNVIFFAELVDHSFVRSVNFQAARGAKNEIDKHRCERIHWISELIRGNVPCSECLLMPSERTNRPDKRLYVLNSECFVVWLEPLQSGDWTFSSAYRPMAYQIKKYRKSAKATIWRYGQ